MRNHEEIPSSALTEFEELLGELKQVEHSKESLFEAFFIDKAPQWRRTHYKIQLKALHLPSHSDPRKIYLYHLKALRKALQRNPKSKEAMRAACVFFLSTPRLHPFSKKVVHLIGGPRHQVSLSASLHARRAAIMKAPRSIKVPLITSFIQFWRGWSNCNFDPYMQENLPYHLFQLRSGPKLLRMGSPTREGYFAPLTRKVKITAEFRAFIESYVQHNKRHLYINLQNRNATRLGQNEASKCRALENLGSEYPLHFTIITLAKNTPFYHQAGPFKKQSSALDFKANLLHELDHPRGGFYFGQLPALRAAVPSLLKEIHERFFSNRSHLSYEERRDFIELFYLELEKCAIKLVTPDTVNITCRDGIDRAGIANALLYLDEHPSCDLDDLETVLFAPALLVKKRAITKPRFDRFVTVSQRLLSKN